MYWTLLAIQPLTENVDGKLEGLTDVERAGPTVELPTGLTGVAATMSICAAMVTTSPARVTAAIVTRITPLRLLGIDPEMVFVVAL